MSTADTLVNASSAVIVNDIYEPLSKKMISAMNATEIKKYDRFFLFIPLNKKIIEEITG